MLVEHQHIVVGECARRARLAAKRDERALGIFRYWSAGGVSVSTKTLSDLMGLPERSARNIISRLIACGAIEKNGSGYRLVKREAA